MLNVSTTQLNCNASPGFFNPFLAVLILQPPENTKIQRFSECFQGVKNWNTGQKRVKNNLVSLNTGYAQLTAYVVKERKYCQMLNLIITWSNNNLFPSKDSLFPKQSVVILKSL